MLVDFGRTILMVSTVALLSLPLGFVILRIGNAWFVDQSLDTAEAVILVFAAVAVLGLIVLAWGTVWMVAPPLVGCVACAIFRLAVRKREQAARSSYDSAVEAKALAMLQRDPSAVVAYERLADLYESEGRLSEALAMLEQWRQRDPSATKLPRRIERLRAKMATSADARR